MKLENMRATSTINLDALWWGNMLNKEILTLHTWLVHKSPSVGEYGETLTTSSIHIKGQLKNNVRSTLLLEKKEL